MEAAENCVSQIENRKNVKVSTSYGENISSTNEDSVIYYICVHANSEGDAFPLNNY
jgi:hypothetical protein